MKSRHVFQGRAPWLMLGAVALVVAAVAMARLNGVREGVASNTAVVTSCELRFEDGPAGSVLVYDWQNGELLRTFESGSGSFVRGVLRSMTRERRSREAGSAKPFRLARHSDGALTIRDEATGRLIVLNAFGPTNAGAFASLLEASRAES